MALGVFPQRYSPPIRPNTVRRLGLSPITRGLAAYYHINASNGYVSTVNQVLRNLVTEQTPWGYSAVVNNLAVINNAPNGFGGSALAIPNSSITISNVNPVLDMSQTGPGYTLSCWGWYGAVTTSLQSITQMSVTDGTNPANMLLQTASGAGSLPQAVNKTNSVTAGRNRLRQWTHLAMTSDGTTLILYQDGQEVGRIAETVSAGSACNQITLNSTSASMIAYGCDYGIWRRCLSPLEVYSLWSPRTRWDILEKPITYRPFTVSTPPVVTFLPRLTVLGMG